MSKSQVMKELPIPQFFSNGHIAGRFLRPLRKYESLVIAVPGGPALPSRYLDEFMLGLSQHLSANVGVIDLPNHGSSVIPFDKLPLRYASCMSYISRTLRELSLLTDKLVIVGHHTGARMILDMIVQQGCRTRAVILIDTPGGTCTMNRWKADVLQLFSSGISQGEATNLAAEIKWDGNEQIFERAPSLRDTLLKVNPDTQRPPMLFLGSEKDNLDQDDLFQVLQTLFPQAVHTKIPHTNGFSMLENPDAVTEQIKSICARGLT